MTRPKFGDQELIAKIKRDEEVEKYNKLESKVKCPYCGEKADSINKIEGDDEIIWNIPCKSTCRLRKAFEEMIGGELEMNLVMTDGSGRVLDDPDDL